MYNVGVVHAFEQIDFLLYTIASRLRFGCYANLSMTYHDFVIHVHILNLDTLDCYDLASVDVQCPAMAISKHSEEHSKMIVLPVHCTKLALANAIAEMLCKRTVVSTALKLQKCDKYVHSRHKLHLPRHSKRLWLLPFALLQLDAMCRIG